MANVRSFDGTDDEILLSFPSALTGAYSMAVVGKPLGGNATIRSPFVIKDSAFTYRHFIQRSSGNILRVGDNAGSQGTTATFVVADGWFMYIATKAAGTSTPRHHYMKAADSTLTHAAAGGTMADQLTSAGGTVRIACFSTGFEHWFGLLARAAVWDVALSDGECDALVGGTKAEWETGSPAPIHLWQFDQASAATPVSDEIGTANQISLVGTSVVTTDDPPTTMIDMADTPPPPTVTAQLVRGRVVGL